VKLRDTVVKFDTYRNVQQHRAVLPGIARHLVKKIMAPTRPNRTLPSKVRRIGPTRRVPSKPILYLPIMMKQRINA